VYLKTYNEKRPHQGRLMNGRTSAEMFKRGLPKARKAVEEPMKQAA